MNYCPNCGFCLKDKQTAERENDPFSKYYNPKGLPESYIVGYSGPYWNQKTGTEEYCKGALNGTKTSTKG